jgi:integrase
MGVKIRELKGKGWYVFTDWNGQRKAKSFGKNKTLAKAFADKLTARLKWAEQNGEPIALSRRDGTVPTVKDYLMEWLKVYAEAHCKPSTASEYRKAIEVYLIPAFGERRLHEVTRADIKRLIASLLVSRKRRTVHNILTPLKEAYNHAIDDGVVTVNPVSNMGRWIADRESASSHINPLTTVEVQTLLKTAQEKYRLFYPLFLCAVRTGMRQGELIGLEWGDIDYHGQYIEVRRAVVRRQLTTTKTHKIRRVEMSPQLASVLRTLQETRLLEASMIGHPIPEPVFLSLTGQRVNDDLLRKAFQSCLTEAGLRRVRFHDLRHTYASLLIQNGANPKYIQEQLGHGSIAITLDVYSHLFAGDHRHHVHSLDDVLDEKVKHEAVLADSATQPQPHPGDESLRSVELIDLTR